MPTAGRFALVVNYKFCKKHNHHYAAELDKCPVCVEADSYTELCPFCQGRLKTKVEMAAHIENHSTGIKAGAG